MFRKILIANRGEIAIRVARAAREMGIETVGVFHKVDSQMPYVNYVDYAYEIFGDTPKSAYLDIQQIIDVAKKSEAMAIHPGYGFLSENSEFADACRINSIVFIGPSATSIEIMGSKTKAREIMSAAGVPIVPGTKERISGPDEAKKIAIEIGLPVLLKAAAGGGGKGMRKVYNLEEIPSAFENASREAAKSFGDDTIYLEKFIENPKHIEIQVIADKFGNYVHLGERDCSIQRRHQKIIEEAPSSVLDENLRAKMGEIAINAAKACNYYNAGTIEFLLDRDKNFYFLEMNTRLQVEHPVTEMVTGVDLVKEQFRVAYGKKLSFKQEDIKISGHAIECRLYAEDPFNNFLPDTGTISYLRQAHGYGVRVDSGIEAGSEISIHFDPMLAKLITYGKDRLEAIAKMEMALKNYSIKGLRTIIPFLLAVMQHPEFRYGYFDTGFIENSFDFAVMDKIREESDELVAAIAAFGYGMSRNTKTINSAKKENTNKWKESQYILRRLI